MLKKKYLFLIIIICLFTISTVSAEDNATSDIISEGNNVNSLEANSVGSNMNSIAKDNDTLKEVNDELLTAGVDPCVTANNTSFIVGNEGILNISGPSDRYGYLNVTINHNVYKTIMKNGFAYLNVSNLGVGVHPVDILYTENDKYYQKEFPNVVQITVYDKFSTPLNINDLAINVDDVAIINVTGIPEALNGTITITITGKASKTAIINNGTASSSFTGITAGNYVISAHYDGDNIYKANTTNATLTVNKLVPNVTAMNTSFIVGNEGILNISGPSDHWGYLNVTINHNVYGAIIKDGFAYLNVSNLDVGVYPVDILYTENAKYYQKKFSNIAQITVYDKFLTPLNINDVTINVDDVATINVTGIPEALNGRNITITITDKASKTAIINNGTASSSFTGITAGNYVISAHYDGDNIYKANTTNATLTVNKLVPNVTAMNTSFIVKK